MGWTIATVLAWVACAGIAAYLIFDVAKVERASQREDER